MKPNGGKRTPGHGGRKPGLHGIPLGTEGRFYCQCGIHWGDWLGHCGICHRTFSNAHALDLHSAANGDCIDPEEMRPVYRPDQNRVYWAVRMFTTERGKGASKTNE